MILPLSKNLRDALDSMYDAKVPQIWRKVTSLLCQLLNLVVQLHAGILGIVYIRILVY